MKCQRRTDRVIFGFVGIEFKFLLTVHKLFSVILSKILSAGEHYSEGVTQEA